MAWNFARIVCGGWPIVRKKARRSAPVAKTGLLGDCVHGVAALFDQAREQLRRAGARSLSPGCWLSQREMPG